MPQFTPWNVPSPFPNVLYNPAAVDQAIAQSQSLLGNLDIDRQKLGLERDKLTREQAAGDAWLKGDGTTTTTGTATNGGGGGGSFLSALAEIESGDKNIVSGVDTDSQGRTAAQGGNASEISQGHFQIQTATWRDFAKQAGVDINQYPNAMSAPREVQAQVASVIPFSRFGPRTQRLMRERFGDFDINQPVGVLAGLGPRTAPAAPGARSAPTQVATAPAAPPPQYNPAAGPRIGAPGGPNITPGMTDQAWLDEMAKRYPAMAGPNDTSQRPDATPTTIPPAVRQAAATLLAMPEAEAAVAYGPMVKELQSRGEAMQAPPDYPGHAAVQAMAGGGGTVPVAPSPTAQRTGGTDFAGPGAAPDYAPAPNKMMYGTGIPGIQISLPTSPLAPSPTTGAPPGTAPATSQAAATPPSTARPPVVQPPPAASRTIPLEPLIQSGPGKDLTPAQFKQAGLMIGSGTPIAGVMAKVEEWRQQNLARRDQAQTAAAAQQQQDYQRQEDYRKAQIEAEKTAYQRQQDAETARRNAAADARAEAEAKRAGLPIGYRLGENGQAVRIDGLPADQAVLEAQKLAGQQAHQQFERENTLRDEFQKLTGDFRTVQTSYENIRNSAKVADGASDMSLLYNYVRLLDPTSVVRESEFAAAAASGSLGQRVQGAVERVLSGARMPDSLRESFVRESRNLYETQLRSHNTVADQYEKLATANGLEPGRVVTRFARPQDDAGPPVVKTDEDFDKLPSGAVFKDPEGHIRKKP